VLATLSSPATEDDLEPELSKLRSALFICSVNNVAGVLVIVTNGCFPNTVAKCLNTGRKSVLRHFVFVNADNKENRRQIIIIVTC